MGALFEIGRLYAKRVDDARTMVYERQNVKSKRWLLDWLLDWGGVG